MIPEIKEAMRASSKIQTEKEILLSVHDLHVWYELRRFGFGFAGHVKAVDGVSFELAQGETVAVVGESGCGKSSLMKTILGINIPTTGELIFEGKNLQNLLFFIFKVLDAEERLRTFISKVKFTFEIFIIFLFQRTLINVYFYVL